MGRINSFFNIGVQEHQPDYLQYKIRLSNIAATALIFVIVIPIIIISYFHFRALMHLPFVGFAIGTGVVTLNYFRVNTVSRCLISVAPTLASTINHAQLISSSEEPVLGFSLFALSTTLLPFILFDFREKGFIIALTAVDFSLMMSLPMLNAAMEVEGVSAEVLRHGPIATYWTVSAIAFALGCLFSLVWQNRTSEEKSERLLAEADINQQKMHESEQILTQNLQKVQQAQEQEKARQWINEGLTEVNRLIRTNDDLAVLGDALISFVIKYVNANQGGFFVVRQDEDEPYIELVSAYAYERKKFMEKRIAVGEGLIGQAYLEKAPIYLTDIPSDYVNITSGLGKATPTCLIVLPLMVEEHVEGLIELAFFHPLQEHERELMNKLSESTAASIRSSRLSQTTRVLLEQAQQQAEEMRAAEEEMRQNMEELSATQEEIHRKEKAYQNEIQQLKEQVDAQATGR